MIVCGTCNEKNQPENLRCNGCGVNLTQDKTIAQLRRDARVPEPVSEKKKPGRPKKK